MMGTTTAFDSQVHDFRPRLAAVTSTTAGSTERRAANPQGRTGIGMIAESKVMRALLDAVNIVATTDTTVLISGETGTGKELIARAIHEASPRRKKRMITVNCAALPRELVESELFGHERGAFTGASERRAGRFELADGGTIFLDEIGELPAEAQAKLLRAIQERTVERVGGNQSIDVDVRIIAATNRNLPRMVRDGEFRSDLFYRLNVYPLEVPPLRDRGQDIELLAGHFLSMHSARAGKQLGRISADALAQLKRHSWPGNVRELENVIERMVIMAPAAGETCDLSEPVSAALGRLPGIADKAASGADRSLDDVVRQHITRVLSHCGGTIEGKDGAAAILGLKPSTLRFRIKQLGVDRMPSMQA